MQFIIVDVDAGDPEFTRVHGPFPSKTAARKAVVLAGEDGRLEDTLWIIPLTTTFP